MSTTMPSAPSAARRNVASTTYVAPCSRWAGPKTSPRKLWAIIMWSRTVTLNTGSLSAVADGVAQVGSGAGGQCREHRRKLLERRLAGDQRVQGRVAQGV